MSRVVVIGAGLGGLGAALRLQGQGHDVVVVEQRARPGGRAYRLADAGYTWDMGPSLITMPWVLEETFAAGGLDMHAELTMRRLDPMYRIHWAGEQDHFDFSGDREELRARRGSSPATTRGRSAASSTRSSRSTRRASWPRGGAPSAPRRRSRR